LCSFFFKRVAYHLDLYSFPTRRSSDLDDGLGNKGEDERVPEGGAEGTGLDDLPEVFQPDELAHRPAHGGVGQAQVDGKYEGKPRSEEHTSELQSRENIVCRLLLEKKNN